jgi:hypothetical protein
VLVWCAGSLRFRGIMRERRTEDGDEDEDYGGDHFVGVVEEASRW